MEIGSILNWAKVIVTLLGDGIALAIIVILYIRDRNAREKEYKQDKEIMEQERKEYKESYQKLVNDIINGVSQHHLTPKEGKNIAQIEKQLNEIIRDILQELNASRVSIMKYHNGNKDMMGTSFLKMSMTNEVVNMGVAPIMSDFKDVFRSFLAYWCHEIDEHGICEIKDYENLKDVDITMYEYLRTRKIEAGYGMALRDTNNDVIGFLCVEYLDKKDFDKDKIKICLCKNYRRIETLMNLNKFEEEVEKYDM